MLIVDLFQAAILIDHLFNFYLNPFELPVCNYSSAAPVAIATKASQNASLAKHSAVSNLGGFQMVFVGISRVINHMTCYKPSALIGWNYSIQTGEQIL